MILYFEGGAGVWESDEHNQQPDAHQREGVQFLSTYAGCPHFSIASLVTEC